MKNEFIIYTRMLEIHLWLFDKTSTFPKKQRFVLGRQKDAQFKAQVARRERLPALFSKNSLVLSSSEVASLYHFPSSRIGRTDNLNTSLSRTLPAPISLKQNTI